MDKLKMHSPDLRQDNIAKIRELFPSCVTEAAGADGAITLAIDFDQLHQELSDGIVEGAQERYHLDWPGKREALIAANAPIAKTLRPCREESVDFDATRNLFIEGDNLEALKLLQETYLGQIKFIYLDPPYNTGKNFIYSDSFTSSRTSYLANSGKISDGGARLTSNPDSNGRFHSNWLTMLYPRLKLAKNLLADDGIIAIHIDEHEYPNLEKIMVEIFGEENNLGSVIWDKRNPKGDAQGVAHQHELIVIYSRKAAIVKGTGGMRRRKENAATIINHSKMLLAKALGVDDEVRRKFKSWLSQQGFSGGELAYSHLDDQGRVFQPVSMSWPNSKPAPSDYFEILIHPVTGKPCPLPEKGWRNPSSTMKKLLSKNLIVFGKDETTQPRRKYFLEENMMENFPSILYFGGSDDNLFKSMGLSFDNPKPLYVSKRLIEVCCPRDGIVLDFFAGSSTSAHATLALNADDGVSRKFIMVQLNEIIPDENSMKKKGFTKISELSTERIRRAGTKILEGDCHPDWNKDVGFRVLKIDSSNMADGYYAPDAINQSGLLAPINNLMPRRVAKDLLFQVLLVWGVDLTLPIRCEQILGKTVFFVGNNTLVACFEDGITEELLKELAQHSPLRLVFGKNGFASDSIKINTEQLLKQLSPVTVVKTL